MSVITVPVARVFVPLLSNDFRYYGAHGGRGSGKSHFFAGRVVDLVADGERWVCVREVQNSIKDSVKTLVEEPGNPDYGATSGAIVVGDEVWLGTFRGNRIARVKRK